MPAGRFFTRPCRRAAETRSVEADLLAVVIGLLAFGAMLALLEGLDRV
jgi:hypothetical protein